MNPGDQADLLGTIAEMLADGLKTQVEPFPETEKEFDDLLVELRALLRTTSRASW